MATGLSEGTASDSMPEPSWKQRLTSPGHAWTRAWVERLPERFPGCADLNALLDPARHLAGSGRPLRFMPAAGMPARAGYEAHIHSSGEVPTRENCWHDLFNALAWLAFPRTKRRLNALHQMHLDDSSAGRRGTARDVLTLFDESGVIAACSDASLAGLLTGFQWKALFWSRRADVVSRMRFVVFGHALQEQAMRPHPGITGKALVIACADEWLAGPADRLLEWLDDQVADAMARPEILASTRSLSPLPLLGIPGWDAANAGPEYYDNRRVFRPGRRQAG